MSNYAFLVDANKIPLNPIQRNKTHRAIPQEKTRLTEANINSSQATFKGCSGR
jgi:hypothetical protein